MKIETITEMELSTKFSDSLKNTGFAVIKPTTDLKPLLDQFYKEWERFFKSDMKARYTHKADSQTGYFPPNSEKAKDSQVFDLKEFFHVYKFGDYPFGIGVTSSILELYLKSLGEELLKVLDKTMPEETRALLSQPLAGMVKDTKQTLFRVLHYPPLKGKKIEAGAVRSAAHEDINLITLLPAATETGLQVKDADGNWHEVSADAGTIVVNAGDMLQEATNGYYKSTTHRVVNPKGEAATKSRYSAPLFVHPRPEVVLSARHTAETYLDERLKEIGLK